MLVKRSFYGARFIGVDIHTTTYHNVNKFKRMKSLCTVSKILVKRSLSTTCFIRVDESFSSVHYAICEYTHAKGGEEADC